ncbi:MAG: single-stranded-DNA-specific exonuclease RecJ [Caulobacteraceae bacterium]
MNKKWMTYEKNYGNIEEIKRAFDIPEIIARSLINRDIDTVEKVARFFNTGIENLYNPYLLKGLGKAVEGIRKAIKSKKKICIYGDYDVDGITSTAIMVKTLRHLGAETIYYIPNRMDEGYGLSKASIEKLKEQCVQLLVTVDCGIRANEVVDLANSFGMEVIITDHHECEDILPNANCIVNPHQPGCEYPFKGLAGVGVAFKLASALLEKENVSGLMKELVVIAAVGTVADVVPLVDENRILVKNGLDGIQNTSNPGLKALLEVCGLNNREISSYNIAFMIAPRVNAAGRIADATLCVELLLTDNKELARDIAKKLDANNRERQSIENEIFGSAEMKISSSVNLNHDKVIVLDSEQWHIGVIGIVASKLVERYHLPTLLITREGDIGKGSARSIPRFNLYEAMAKCSDLFEKFGGHELAAGFTIKTDKIDELRKRMNLEAESILGKEKLMQEVLVDYKLSPKDISLNTVKQLRMLEPFGIGNPSPLFVYRGLKLLSAKAVGNDSKHLLFNVFDGVNEIRCIGFNLGNMQRLLSIGKKIDIICNVENNIWNNIESLQLSVKDIKLAIK